MSISNEAVEAAAKAMHDDARGADSWSSAPAERKQKYESYARLILEAAAPHMLVPSAAEQAMDRILITLTAVAAGQVPQDVAFTVIREISESYADENEGEK